MSGKNHVLDPSGISANDCIILGGIMLDTPQMTQIKFSNNSGVDVGVCIYHVSTERSEYSASLADASPLFAIPDGTNDYALYPRVIISGPEQEISNFPITIHWLATPYYDCVMEKCQGTGNLYVPRPT